MLRKQQNLPYPYGFLRTYTSSFTSLCNPPPFSSIRNERNQSIRCLLRQRVSLGKVLICNFSPKKLPLTLWFRDRQWYSDADIVKLVAIAGAQDQLHENQMEILHFTPNGKSAGVAYLEFENWEAAKKAWDLFNGV